MSAHPSTRELRERIEVATEQCHDANEWHFAEAPDGQGSLLDWVCRVALQSPSPMEDERAAIVAFIDDLISHQIATRWCDAWGYLRTRIERGDHLATIRGEDKP